MFEDYNYNKYNKFLLIHKHAHCGSSHHGSDSDHADWCLDENNDKLPLKLGLNDVALKSTIVDEFEYEQFNLLTDEEK